MPLQWSRPQLRTETRLMTWTTYSRLMASMEPSSVEDGNRAEISMSDSSLSLQWSRPQLRTETIGWRDANNTGLHKLQWSRPQLRTETLQRCEWLREHGWLQWSRPQLRTETLTAAATRSYRRTLQWSRPQLRTETHFGLTLFRVDKLLQWSRPQLRTETATNDHRHTQSDDASMEPSSVEDGNLSCG